MGHGVWVLAFARTTLEWWKRFVPDENDQRSDAVRITNDWVASVAMADPVKWSLTSPICGSSEKLIVTVACGLTKCARIRVMSVSPSTVVDIDALALGARIMTRIQTSLAEAAEIRADVATTLP